MLGPQTYHRLPDMVPARSRAAGDAVIDTDFPPKTSSTMLPEAPPPQGMTAFLTIQEGCDKFCSFCVVPYTRGAEQSRPAAAVLAEARRLVTPGAREITLLGQNVNAWHGEAPDGRHLEPRPADPRSGRTSPGCCGCATPPRTHGTWTTT